MLKTVLLDNFRGFQKYRLTGLSRVNLLVGKNNCGKTSLLEAIHLLESGADPRVLWSGANRRGETISVQQDDAQKVYPDISHFFWGHRFLPDRTFEVGCENDDYGVIARVLCPIDSLTPADTSRERVGLVGSYALELSEWAKELREPSVYQVSEEGALITDSLTLRRLPRESLRRQKSVGFVSQDSLDANSMAGIWQKVAIENRESEVIEALSILNPGIADIVFLPGNTKYPASRNSGIVVGVKGEGRRLPLGSLGDGMRRLLSLTLSLIEARGGVLLVDELDTGLHYSVMGDLWLLVVNAAIKSDVQVFATTHSEDCVRGLAWLCKNEPELGEHVSLQKIDQELGESIALDCEKIRIADDTGIEVR